jgi:hypothetical protein
MEPNEMTIRGIFAFLARRVWFLVALLSIAAGAAAAWGLSTPACAGTLNVGSFRLLVEPAKGGPPLPVQSVNILQPGEKLKYEPLHLAPAIKNKARIAVLLVPAVKPDSKARDKDRDRDKDKDSEAEIDVLEARPAKAPAEWEVPVRTAVVGVVFGPHGLDVKKVSSLVEKNPDLIPELTEYAGQAAKVGALVQTLSEYEQAPGSGRDLNALLKGFSSKYDISIPKLDTTAPANQQAAQMLRALIPSLSSYDPLTSTPTGTVQQSAGLSASVATLFFGTPVGLVAGGTALFLNLRTLMFPDADFRSAFTQPAGSNGLALCSKNEPVKSRTRVAYLWMMCVPNAAAPVAALAETANVPLGGKATLKVNCAKPADLKLLPRAREWELVSEHHHANVPVKVEVAPSADSLELDLAQAKLPAGEYQLAALWDWEPLKVAGNVEVRPRDDFSKVKVAQDSEDHLVEGSGPVRVQLTGADFEFVEKVAIIKAGDKQAKPRELTFTLPKGKAQGEQTSLETEVDTSALEPDSYRLLMTQTTGATHDVAITIHPPNPKLVELPWRVNLGELQQTMTLRGTSLERIARISSRGATWELAPAQTGARDLKERSATVKLLPGAHQGELLGASVTVEGIESPLEIPGVLQVAGPLPRIVTISKSFAQEPGVALREGEIPAGSTVSFALRTENLGSRPALGLACANEGLMKQLLTLHPGDRSGGAQLDFAGEGVLFLSLDPGGVGQSGCQLTATVTTDSAGSSDSYALGRVIRLPRIEKFALTEEKLGGALYAGLLTGQELQMIEKTGWDPKTGYPVQDIPTAVAGNPQEHTLKVALPWPPPSPRAPIYVWLRGESEGRLTNAKY